MNRTLLGMAAVGVAPLLIAVVGGGTWATDPPGAPYKPAHERVPLPEFVAGLGKLYVDPATLPAGTFLAYNRKGNLVSSVYMIPLDDLNARKEFPALGAGQTKANLVTMNWVGGHPGVTQPHYHFVIGYISPGEAAALK